MRVDPLAEDKSGGLLCLHIYLRLGNEGGHQGKNEEAKRLGIPCGPVVRTPSTEATGLIPGQGTKIPQDTGCV